MHNPLALWLAAADVLLLIVPAGVLYVRTSNAAQAAHTA